MIEAYIKLKPLKFDIFLVKSTQLPMVFSHFRNLVSFYALWKHQKTISMERHQCHEMGQIYFNKHACRMRIFFDHSIAKHVFL